MGEGKKIFGSVTSADVAEAIKEQIDRDVDKSALNLPEMRQTGNYKVTAKLHPEVTAQFTVVVQGQRQ